jgi:beta-glucanase (GH16 family)
MKKIVGFFIIAASVLSACAAPTPTPVPTPTNTPEPTPTPVGYREGWNLVWQDEFDGDTLNEQNWTFDLGGGGWGNAEWEKYTNNPENVRVENGNLIIEARKENDPSAPYTSARLKTQGLQSWVYGRIEARIKLPSGQGIWPAFWMLGDDIRTSGWPNCGEIDILEFIGKTPHTIYHNVHGPGYSGAKPVGTRVDMTPGVLLNEFHTYAIEWSETEIRWFVDDKETFKVTTSDVPVKWVFDHNFFIIMNIAVGGNWPGYPTSSTEFPVQMIVDHVRVYQRP